MLKTIGVKIVPENGQASTGEVWLDGDNPFWSFFIYWRKNNASKTIKKGKVVK